MVQDHHENFMVEASGLIINPELPWLAATPDGRISCQCHGDVVLEIKCPFTSKDCSLTDCLKDPRFCLGIGEDGTPALKGDHDYMFQVQAQMHIANVNYCDFLVWAPQQVFLQRIRYDAAFFQNAYKQVVLFIKTGVFPELLGKWYSKPRHTSTTTATEHHHNNAPTPTTTTKQSQNAPTATTSTAHHHNAPTAMGCYCGKPREISDEVTCTAGNCVRKYFHRSCLKLTRVPKTWKCVDCKKRCVVIESGGVGNRSAERRGEE